MPPRGPAATLTPPWFQKQRWYSTLPSAVLNPLDGVDVDGLVVPLQADAHLQALLAGHFGSRQHLPHARRVGGHRLFQEHVFAGLDGILELGGPKAGRGGEDHDVGPAVDGLAIGVQPHELPLARYVDLLGEAGMGVGVVAGRRAAAEDFEAHLQAVFKGVGHGPQLDRPRGAQRLGRRSGSPPAATHQGQLQLVAAGGMGGAGDIGQRAPRGAGQHTPEPCKN